jgi:transcriptional regulator with XRE-family HTH domain
MARGRKLSAERIRHMAELRQQGLTYAEIGRRLGVTRQAVQSALQRTAERAVPCGNCGGPIAFAVVLPRYAGKALCQACLARLPAAPFAQRLLALRLAADLTQTELARRSGVQRGLISNYEIRGDRPGSAALAKLAGVLGPGLESRGSSEHTAAAVRSARRGNR